MNRFIFNLRNTLIFLTLFFLFTRLYNLTLLPIFTDEAVYIYWGKYIATYNSHWLMSLTAGDPPLFTWITIPLLKVFPEGSYLLAGRFVSVLAGTIALFGIYNLSVLLFANKRTGILAMLFYILSPFTLFYDRLALYDSLLSALLIWSVYFALKTSRTLYKKYALCWGVFLGLGLLTKSTALIFLILTPICFFIFLDRKKSINFKKIILLLFIAIIIVWALYSIQMLSPNFQTISSKTQHFRVPFSMFFSNPYAVINANLSEIFSWIMSYYTFPVLLVGGIGLLIILKRNFTKGSILLFLWIAPILVFATIGKILFPRYILFVTPYFLICLSESIRIISSSKQLHMIQILVVVIMLLATFQFNMAILTNPSKAPLPTTDYNQFISDKPSGYGLSDIYSFLDKELNTGPRITLVTQGKFGLFPYAFVLKYWNDTRITIFSSQIPNEYIDFQALGKATKVYVVYWDYKAIPSHLPLRLVMKAEKPGGKNAIVLAEPK